MHETVLQKRSESPNLPHLSINEQSDQISLDDENTFTSPINKSQMFHTLIDDENRKKNSK